MAKAEKVAVKQPVGEGGEEEVADGAGDDEVEIEEIIEESRAERIKRSGLQRMENIKKAFSKENMEKQKQKTRENLEKTRQRTRENLEKTRQRTRENLDKTRQNLEQKMGKMGTERKEKLRMSREKLKKSLHLERSGGGSGGGHPRPKPKATTYRVPPFTFHVKKVREGQLELEKVEVEQEEANPVVLKGGLEEVSEDEALEVEVEEGVLVSLDSPEMEAVLEVADSSKLVLVDTELPNQKKGK